MKRSTLIIVVSATLFAGCVQQPAGVDDEKKTSEIVEEIVTETPEQSDIDYTPKETAEESTAETGKNVQEPKWKAAGDETVAGWLNDDGKFTYPFDMESVAADPDIYSEDYEKMIRTNPEEVSRALTGDLLDVCTDDLRMYFYMYNNASDYLRNVETEWPDVFPELLARDDLADVLMEKYSETTFVNEEYTPAAHRAEQRIALTEILLAKNEIFDLLDDKKRENVISMLYSREQERSSGKFPNENKYRGFAAYSCELKEAGDSKWYDYYFDNGFEEKYPGIFAFDEGYKNWIVDPNTETIASRTIGVKTTPYS